MRANTCCIAFPPIYVHALINAKMRYWVDLRCSKKTYRMLFLYVKFLLHSPWFYAESDYLRSGGSPIMAVHVFLGLTDLCIL